MSEGAEAEAGRRRSALADFATRFGDWQQYVVYVGFIVIFVIFAITLRHRGFLAPFNLLNIVRQSAIIAIMATATTFVLCAGEIDLSVGALAGFSSVTTAMAIGAAGTWAGVGAGLATGLVVGIVNALLTTVVGIPSFLTTLAMMGIASGTAMWVSGSAAIPIVDPSYTAPFGSGDLGVIPSLFFWMAAIAVIGHVGLRKTSFGRKVLATGGGVVSARYSGVDTRAIKRYVLIASALSAAVAGMLYAGRLHTGRFQLGQGDELSVIAAAVLGGTSLFGGKGTVAGSIVGALMIGLINNGLILMNLQYSQQLIARGVIIILAVALGSTR
ncbi:MAG: ABC transporter permease [Acetobacteraceae bacterium]